MITPNGSEQLDVEITYDPTGISDSMEFDVVGLELDVDCGDFCDILKTDYTFDDPDEYVVTISRDEMIEMRIHECPDSDADYSEAECILIESLGDGEICLAFSRECDSDRVAHMID